MEIYRSAAKENAVVLTKDEDFVSLLSQHGPPPQIIWLRCGNILKSLFTKVLPGTLDLIKDGQPLVEIKDAS